VNRCMTWFVYGLIGLCVMGVVFGQKPRSEQLSATIPTMTVVSVTSTSENVAESNTAAECDMTYRDVVVDTVKKLDEAMSIAAVDALITRYDATKPPYGCGRNDALLDMTDTSMRIALGERRTVMMSDNPDKHVLASKVNANEALETIAEWANE
jgi:hypothetical protein